MSNMDIVGMQADRLLERAKEINRLLEEVTCLRAELKGAYEQGLLDGREQAVDDYRGAIDSYER